MKLTAVILVVLGGLGGRAAAQNPEIAAGRASFTEGDFRRAAAHFERVLKTDPDYAEACYWTGITYERMADLATPFGGRYHSKARVYLTRAVNLAPGRAEYRLALFDFLLDSASDSSRAPLRRAEGILRSMSPSDPDYEIMSQRLADASNRRLSADSLLGDLLLSGPRALYRIAAAPASAVSSVRTARPQAAAGE